MSYPEGVLNKKAWDDYVEMKAALDKAEDRFYKCSNGKTIDFLSNSGSIRLTSEGCTEQESKLITNLIHKFSSLKSLVNLKKKESLKKNEQGELVDTKDILRIRESEILEYFGRFYKIEEILKIINVDWGYSLSKSRLRGFFDANIEKITQLREEFKRDYSDIRLGYKRSRLDELCYIYQITKDKYSVNHLREDAKLMMSLLEQIRKECEGDLTINVNGKIEVEQSIQLQIQTQEMRNFNITSLIINNMAGKAGVNPAFILSRLRNSYYAKFTGFKNEGDKYNDEIYSPTGVVCDLDDIENKNIEVTKEENKLKQLPSIEEKEKDDLQAIKEKLLSKLSEEQLLVNKIKQNLQSNY